MAVLSLIVFLIIEFMKELEYNDYIHMVIFITGRNKMQIEFFITENKRNPVLDFINKQEKKDQATILGCLQSVQELGLETPRVKFRQIDGRLWEIKIRTPNGGYRIFYMTISKERMILLHAYQKKSQKAPKKEISMATKRLKVVLEDENSNA